MKAVGIRDLKDHLSEYLRRVRAGESILVTNRGEVVAELREPGAPSASDRLPEGLGELVRRGSLRPGRENDPGRYPLLQRVAPDGTALAWLDADRGEAE